MKERCGWGLNHELEFAYHDNEWGIPVHDDCVLFEFLTLEGAQAGLSWSTVLEKRENYRKLFDGFDFEKIAKYDEKKITKLLENPGIIRNRLKVNSTVTNAQAFIKIREEFGSFDSYIWSFVDNKPIQNQWKTMREIPAQTELSVQISKDLKKRGFRFVGPTIIYAFMQAIGMVNDHIMNCFRYKEIKELVKKRM
ncbi:MAG: DNA-3-methyladenine glycosylase I [Asgard group archaeon]|nr:DNA-3-methyladenine glycosylase I [Asgard group archaeon]